MLDLLTALWLGFIGACIGSFLNVVAYRMPRGMSVVWKPSHCPQCGHDIRPRDNLPVLSWLLLRGRCRDCGQPISSRYAIVEATMGAAFVALAYAELFSGAANLPSPLNHQAVGAWDAVWNPDRGLIALYSFHAILLSLLMAMALIDQDGQRIPWKLVAFAAIVVVVGVVRWPYLYPERTRNIRVLEWKAPLDALLGAAWGGSALMLPYTFIQRHLQPATRMTVVNAAFAAAVTGGFLGLRPIVRIGALWLLGVIGARSLSNKLGRISPLLILWTTTLLHLLFWKHFTTLVSW